MECVRHVFLMLSDICIPPATSHIPLLTYQFVNIDGNFPLASSYEGHQTHKNISKHKHVSMTKEIVQHE